MLNVLNDRVIIDSHEPTREQCETMTLLANALDKSADFKTVQYVNGYAEFERVGRSSELKFVAGPASFSVIDSVTGDTVIYVNSDGDIALSFSGKLLTLQMRSGNYLYNIATQNDNYVDSVTTDSNNVTTVVMKSNIVAISSDIGNVNNITITFEQGGGSTMTKQVDLTTLSGWANLPDGEHTITVVAMGTGYANSDKSAGVTVTKGSAGETWVLNETLDVFDGMPPTTNILFISNGTQYSKISNSGGITASILYDTTEVYSYEFQTWTNTAYRTITFSTAPTGDLLTWLQANATKQGGGAVTLISFTIRDTTYQAEEGMTWQQWIDSDYNTTNWRFAACSNRIDVNNGAPDGYAIVDSDNNAVLATSVIISGEAYSLTYAGVN